MTTWIRVAPTADIRHGDYASAEVDGVFVAVYNIDGEFFAIDDVCTHDGGPLAEGDLDGFEIQCPRHGARFDVSTGRALCLPAFEPVTTHEVEVRDDAIFVSLNE